MGNRMRPFPEANAPEERHHEHRGGHPNRAAAVRRARSHRRRTWNCRHRGERLARFAPNLSEPRIAQRKWPWPGCEKHAVSSRFSFGRILALALRGGNSIQKLADTVGKHLPYVTTQGRLGAC